jgi:hypothetical protein
MSIATGKTKLPDQDLSVKDMTIEVSRESSSKLDVRRNLPPTTVSRQ